MFPWNDGFHWTVIHVVFLSIFFAVVLTILTTVTAAAWQTASNFLEHHDAEVCWRENFGELPDTERRCRHQLAGRVQCRVCDNAFDCRTCQNYAKFASLPANAPAKNVGIPYSDNLLYHRGHTWVRPESDGTFAVGLDEFAHHLIGQPDSVKLPTVCDELESEGIAWRMTKNGHEISVCAPIGGTIISIGGPDKGWYLKILPYGQPNLRHLLRGSEVPGWLAAEIDRLQMQLSAPGAKPCLADGGTLMPDLMDAEPTSDWDTVLASTFLEP